MSDIKIGDLAPDFSIKIGENKIKTLKDYNGSFLVIYFYPKDNTPGCTIEAMEFNSLLAEFKENNSVVLGVSKDSLDSHEKFKGLFSLNFDLGSDSDSNLCESFKVWGEKSMFGKKYMGVTRASFLIDPNGKIAYIWDKVSANGHAKEVLAKIKELS